MKLSVFLVFVGVALLGAVSIALAYRMEALFFDEVLAGSAGLGLGLALLARGLRQKTSSAA